MPKQVHPNSLKNLKPLLNSENAKEYQKRSVEARRANKEARERAEERAQEMSLMVEMINRQGLSTVDRLKVLAEMHLDKGEVGEAVDILKSVAEYETPKLARIDQTVTEKGVEELTDEELASKLKELSKNLK